MEEDLRKAYEIIIEIIGEARDYIEKGNPIQASKKLYKAVEEAIKVLARLHQLEEYKASIEIGRWNIDRLDKAAKKLAKIYGEDLYTIWEIAYERLRIEGFHEGRLSLEEVREKASQIEALIALVSRILEKQHSI